MLSWSINPILFKESNSLLNFETAIESLSYCSLPMYSRILDKI